MASTASAQPIPSATPDERVSNASPTLGTARVDSLDVLRGVAVLMIFVVNIKMMAAGFNHYVTRSLWEGETASWIAFIQGEFIHGNFVTIFTGLFGAGLALLLAREKPVPLPVVLRRLFWLTVFGGLHLIFLREGDILIWYALVGFPALLFARARPAVLFTAGAALQALVYLYYMTFPLAQPEASAILWSDAADMHFEVADIMLGSVSEQINARIGAAYYYMVDLFLLGGVWIDTLSVMLLGMGLLKVGFLGGEWPLRAYAACVIGGAVVAALEHLVPLALTGGTPWEAQLIGVAGYLHRFGGALAWSALIVGAVAAGWKAKAFAAAGRTAFTIYIVQSVIGLALFSSLGLGLFGQLSLGALMGVNFAVWALFLIAAPLWLARYRFGPLEWLWRSLTYQKAQPMRRV